MWTSVPSWAARLRAGFGAGLARPIVTTFAVVLVVVMGMFAMQLRGARTQHETADSARHAEQVLDPYLDARSEIPADEAELLRLTLIPAQHRRAEALTRAIDAYMDNYAAPLRANGLVMTREEVLAAADAGKREIDAVRSQFE